MKLSRRSEYEIAGQVIKEAREELGIAQRALARKLGRTETAISKIESGNQRVDMVELFDIAQALRIPLASLAEVFEQRVLTRSPTKKKGESL